MREDIRAAILKGIDPAFAAPSRIQSFRDYIMQPQIDSDRQYAFDCVKQVLGDCQYTIKDRAVRSAVEYMFDERPADFQRYIVSVMAGALEVWGQESYSYYSPYDGEEYIDGEFLEEFFADAVHEFHRDILRL